MIRAFIGTVAVLAGFAVVERSSDASTGQAGSCKITQAYAMLHPGEQVPVRTQPTPEGTVMGALATQNMAGDVALSMVTLTGSQNGWARIALTSKDYTAIDGKGERYGWIPADLLAVNSRLNGTVTMYDRPGVLGTSMGTIKDDDQKFRVLGCNGDLLQVINSKQGNIWIDRWCAKEEGCRG